MKDKTLDYLSGLRKILDNPKKSTEMSNEEFEEYAKTLSDYLANKPKEVKDFEEEIYKPKDEDFPFSDKEMEDIYTAMYESDDPDYTDFYLKKYPEMRDKKGDIDYKHSTPELGKEYMKQHPELWKQTREWLDINKEVDEREEKKYQEELSKLDTNNNGKVEKSEMENFTDSLNDYMDKNKKGRDDIPVTTRR